MIRELIQQNRSYRRFQEDVAVSRAVLEDLVDLARQSASAGNRQPLRYVLSWTEQRNQAIFPALAWAAYLKGWGGPAAGERPSAYIVVVTEQGPGQEPVLFTDLGIATQNILLGAAERGLGGCIIHAFNRNTLQAALSVPETFRILEVIALGKPKERVVLDEMAVDGDYKYWRDQADVHHVPKRRLADVVVEFQGDTPD